MSVSDELTPAKTMRPSLMAKLESELTESSSRARVISSQVVIASWLETSIIVCLWY